MTFKDMAFSYRMKNNVLYIQIDDVSIETYKIRLQEERATGRKCFAVKFKAEGFARIFGQATAKEHALLHPYKQHEKSNK